MPYRVAVRRPVGTLMLCSGLVFFGLFAAVNLPLDFLPSISMPTLVVSAAYPGASSEEVRQLVTIPLEDSFASLKGVRSLRSVSRRGVSTLTIDFQWGTDMTLAGVEAREIIDASYPLLPQDTERPQVLPVDPNAQPVLVVGVRAQDGSLETARMLADREVKTSLQQVEGVGSVILVGGSENEVQVQASQPRLLAAGLSIDDLASFLGGASLDLPAGSFTEGTSEFLVRTNGRAGGLEELAALRVPLRNGGSVRVGDLSSVSWQPKERMSLFMNRAVECIGLVVRGRGGESPVRLSERLRREIDRLSTAYDGSIELSVVEDSSSPILQSIQGLVAAGMIGAAAAFLVMLIFLRRLRLAAILITAVPSSVLFCLLLLWATGRTINVMSLGGIALSVGMLVDDGVVVLENLQRRVSRAKEGTLPQVIIAATSEVAGSILGSTLTTLIVFFPVLFLPGLIGALYTDLALAVIYCLFASLVVSVTLIPVLFLITSPRRAPEAGTTQGGGLERGYRGMLARALRRPAIVAGALSAIACATVPLALGTRLELVAPYDSGSISVRVVAPPSTSMAQLRRIQEEASRTMLAQPRVQSVWSRAGGENNDTFYLADPDASRETISFSVRTRPGRRPDSGPVVEALRRALVIDGAEVTVELPRSSLAQLLGLRSSGPALSALGATPQKALARAREIERTLRAAQPTADIRVAEAPRVSEIRYTPNRETLARAGIALSTVARSTWEGLEGTVATRLSTGGRDYDVRVLLARPDRSGLQSLAGIAVRSSNGAVVDTGELVRIDEGSSPSVLVRENRQDVSVVEIGASNPTPALRQAMKEMEKSTDVTDATRTIFSQHASEILLILGIALVLLYLLLGAQFESFTQPLIILVAVPLAVTGVLGALLATEQSLNLGSGLGILVLFGTVVKTSIILFANYRRRIDAGAAPSLAIYLGTSERLRPILISALATVVGLLPIAVNWDGLSTEDGIAIAVIGGLLVSTILTLFVVPLLTWRYYLRRLPRGAAATGAGSPARGPWASRRRRPFC
jgi:hydrophobic/amphiphilic exporter-1 (mainly G- bacteria), HAE1 family